jgi:hypothetical protein
MRRWSVTWLDRRSARDENIVSYQKYRPETSVVGDPRSMTRPSACGGAIDRHRPGFTLQPLSRTRITAP